MIQKSNPNTAPASKPSTPDSRLVSKPDSNPSRRPEPFPKERVAKQIASKQRAMKQALPKERERVAKQDLRVARQREKRKEKRRLRALNKTERKQEVLKKASKKACSRSRLVKRLTKTQYVCTRMNFHARRYQLRRPNVKNRSRRARKKKLNKWLRVCVGRSVVTSPSKKTSLNSMRADYKNTRLLKHFISFQGKIMNRKQNRVCAKEQRVLKRVIKTSRNAGLLPSMQG